MAFCLISMQVLWAQTKVSGKVTTASGEALEGATIMVKGMEAGALAESDGSYTVEVPAGGTTLVFSYLNYKTVEEVINGRTTINVAMADEATTSDDVVITALGVSRDKKSLGYSSQELQGSTVSNVKETNFLNSLSGKVAGMQVAGGSGNLGSSTRVLIRGVRSLTGDNQPLYVVDGIPMDNTNNTTVNQARGAGGYDYGNPIQDINPADIESINVLKGAAATALYGARGNNGVIMITTKKGKANGGKAVEITLNSQTTFETVAVLPQYQNSYGGGYGFDTVFTDPNDPNKYDLYADYATDESWGPKFDPNVNVRQFYSFSDYAPEYKGKATPWVASPNNIRDFYQTGVAMTNSVGVAGGNDFATFRMGYTNLRQTGVMPNSNLNRHAVNINAGFKPFEKLLVSVGANYVNTRAKGRSGTGYDGGNVSQAFNQWHQRQIDMDILRKYYELPDGTQMTWNRTSATNATPKYTDNPYWTAYKNFENDGRDRLFGNMTAAYQITSNLTLTGRVMNDFYTDKREERIAVGSQDIPGYALATRNNNELNTDLILDYKKNFGENFSLNAFVGANNRVNTWSDQIAVTQGGLLVSGLYNIANSVSTPSVTDAKFTKSIRSGFGSLSLGFWNMLYIDGTMRVDRSSTLPVANNTYRYGSLSGAFVFSELDALKNSKVISFGKLRGSVGTVGNDANPYQLNDTYSLNAPFGSYPSAGINNASKNPNLKPEKSTTTELGLEMKFFNNRLGFDVSAYNNLSVNQVLPVTVSPTTGYTQKVINAGKLQNKGIEVAGTVTPIRTKNFSWDIGVNWSANRNKVVELYVDPNTNDTIKNYQLANAPFAVTVNATLGEPYGSIRGRDIYYNSNGQPIIGPDGYYIQNPAIQTIGNIMPKWIGGVNNTFTYKNLSVGFLIDMRRGGDLFSTSYMWGLYSGLLDETVTGYKYLNEATRNQDVREKGGVLDGVLAEVDANGDVVYNDDGSPKATTTANNVNLPALAIMQDNGAYFASGKQAVFNGGFIKLREARINYTLPNKWFGAKCPLKDVSLAVVGRNLWIIQKYTRHIDPDNAFSAGNVQGIEGAQLPSTRSVGFTLGAKF